DSLIVASATQTRPRKAEPCPPRTSPASRPLLSRARRRRSQRRNPGSRERRGQPPDSSRPRSPRLPTSNRTPPTNPTNNPDPHQATAEKPEARSHGAKTARQRREEHHADQGRGPAEEASPAGQDRWGEEARQAAREGYRAAQDRPGAHRPRLSRRGAVVGTA